MNSRLVQESAKKFSEVLSLNYPTVGWYFSSEAIEDSFIFKRNKWACMLMYIKIVVKKGKRIRFSKDIGQACTGPTEFFGFAKLVDDGGVFLVEVERFFKNLEISQAYNKESEALIHPPPKEYLYMEQLETIDNDQEIEVVNLFPADLTNLTKLVTLSGYDSTTSLMDNVLIPNCSGCQSVFAIPYSQKFNKNPKSIVGLMDPMVRNFVPEDMVSFSVPASRFIEMANNIEGSFLDKNFDNPTGF